MLDCLKFFYFIFSKPLFLKIFLRLLLETIATTSYLKLSMFPLKTCREHITSYELCHAHAARMNYFPR